MTQSTARRRPAVAAVGTPAPDGLPLTPEQRAALHQVYTLILSFAQPPSPAPVPVPVTQPSRGRTPRRP